MAPHFIVVASEHRLRVLERFARPGQLTPTLREIVTRDHAGMVGAQAPHDGGRMMAFPTHGQSAADLSGLDTIALEDRRRSCDWLAEQIERFLMDRPGQAWAFAAAPHLHGSVMDRLRPSVRGSMVEGVQRNLVHLAPSDLAVQFRVRF